MTRPRGRPEIDIAARIRNWGWCWLVKTELQLSDDALDERFGAVMSSARRRLFFQIRRDGASPRSFAGKRGRGGATLFHAVHRDGGCEEARLWFEAPIWELLQDPQMPSERVQEALDVLVRENSCYRVAPDDMSVGQWTFPEEPAFVPPEATELRRELRALRRGWPRIASLSLLCLLYRESEILRDHASAAALEMEMLAAPQELWPSESMKEGLSELLQAVIRLRLVEKRALNFAEVARCRTQEPETSPAGYVSARKWLKTMGNPSKDKLEDLCDWMVEAAKTPRPSIRRVVYRTPQLEWFEESLKPLHGQYRKWRLGPLIRPRVTVEAEVLERMAALRKTCPS